MKIKSRLGDAHADGTEGHQIKSTRSSFDFRRVSSTVLRLFFVPCLKVNSFDYINSIPKNAIKLLKAWTAILYLISLVFQ